MLSQIQLKIANNSWKKHFISRFFVLSFFHKGALISGGQIAVISDTDNHVALSQTFQCPHLFLSKTFTLSLSLPLSQVEGCSCRCHMMSCGPVVVAEQWQFYPCAIWSTRHSMSHGGTHTHALKVYLCLWASLYDHKSGHRQYQPLTMCSCLCLYSTVQRLHSLFW